ncbi:MAG: hypothetical protein NZ960_01910 [Candidatus Kapabacteria bacterium]|nr:hypothetical protein [Candidatus Kapabacteria bacterium]MDW8011780.1 hypothetical protein [Bacteroidota bacterium]
MATEDRSFLQQHLSAYVDGIPLEPSVRARLERLLATNPEYAHLYRTEKAVATLLRQRQARLRQTAPPELLGTLRLAMHLRQRRARRRRRLLVTAGALLVAGAGLWLWTNLPVRPSPACFATALRTSLHEFQRQRLAVAKVGDIAELHSLLRQNGIPYPLSPVPRGLSRAELVGVAIQQVNGYSIPIAIYHAPEGWLMFAKAPRQAFDQQRLWLDSSIWEALHRHEWKWQSCDSIVTCAFWEQESFVCGIATTLPPQKAKLLLHAEWQE